VRDCSQIDATIAADVLTFATSIFSLNSNSSRAGENPMSQSSWPPRFQTRAQVNRYFGGTTIRCLLCGGRFRRLASHLALKHGTSASGYKRRFGLPWSRGLTSATSHRKSGWNAKRRAVASKLAHRTRFFEHAHTTSRRESPEYIKREWSKNLGAHSRGFGSRFERSVRKLFERGLVDREIARTLGVNRMTVNQITRKWRKSKRP
jgi:predicted transcriptional regulator